MNWNIILISLALLVPAGFGRAKEKTSVAAPGTANSKVSTPNEPTGDKERRYGVELALGESSKPLSTKYDDYASAISTTNSGTNLSLWPRVLLFSSRGRVLTQQVLVGWIHEKFSSHKDYAGGTIALTEENEALSVGYRMKWLLGSVFHLVLDLEGWQPTMQKTRISSPTGVKEYRHDYTWINGDGFGGDFCPADRWEIMLTSFLQISNQLNGRYFTIVGGSYAI